MPDLSGQTIDRYHLIEKLGEGGMAIVYKAFDTRLERDVAIKIIRSDLFGNAVIDRILKRFEREAKAMAKMSHANIVKVLDFGEHDGNPYLVLELLTGGTLKQLLGKPMPFDQAARLLEPIAWALEYAHSKNILHRDVKPSNILITDNGSPVLTDFGIAKILDLDDGNTLTGTGVGVGTPEYMAPEQGMGKEVDARADIYALGVVFFELITARKPYIADTPMAVVFKHLTDPLPRPREFVSSLPEDVEKVLFKAMAKKPDDRYQDMGEFAVALHRLVSSTSEESRQERNHKPDLVGWVIDTTQDTLDTLETERGYLGQVSLKQPLQLPRQQETHDKKTTPTLSRILGYSLAGIALLVIIVGISGGFKNKTTFEIEVKATNTPDSIETPTTTPYTAVPIIIPATTSIPPTSTVIPPTPTEELLVGSKIVSQKDNMTLMYVPAGEFVMGWSQNSNSNEFKHDVYLSAYWMDRTEVTNAQYKLCVSAGSCKEPGEVWVPRNYFTNAIYNDYPVVNVTWKQANDYCAWANRRLPTEAEWEKAARGPLGYTYPWGDEFSCKNGNFNDNGSIPMTSYVPGGPNCDGFAYMAPVGSFPQGASPYRVLDMAGNVNEWVSDWWKSDYYKESPTSNPLGPPSGTERVMRGSDYDWQTDFYSAYRGWGWDITASYDFVGFRCAMDAK